MPPITINANRAMTQLKNAIMSNKNKMMRKYTSSLRLDKAFLNINPPPSFMELLSSCDSEGAYQRALRETLPLEHGDKE